MKVDLVQLLKAIVEEAITYHNHFFYCEYCRRRIYSTDIKDFVHNKACPILAVENLIEEMSQQDKMDYYKKVMLPITVTIGNYCWGNERICGYFSNNGKYDKCTLGFLPLERDEKERVLKPKGCRALK